MKEGERGGDGGGGGGAGGVTQTSTAVVCIVICCLFCQIGRLCYRYWFSDFRVTQVHVAAAAHYESLRKEAQRLRALQQQQHQLQQVSPACTFELQQQQFSKLDLGASTQVDTKSAAVDSIVLKNVSGVPAAGAVSRTTGRTQGPKGTNPSCMVPVIGRNPDGRMLSGSTHLPPEYLLQDP